MILIFGLFGIPAMGIKGAAVATVVGQLAAGAVAIAFNTKKEKENIIKNPTEEISIG